MDIFHFLNAFIIAAIKYICIVFAFFVQHLLCGIYELPP